MPVALVSGLSRASRVGAVVRGGGAPENLGRARTLLLDKTGTLIGGRPRVLDVAAAPGWRPAQMLCLAAALDQYSPHVLAHAVADDARERGLALPVVADVTEEPGRGASGTGGRAAGVHRKPDVAGHGRDQTEDHGELHHPVV
ncbi:hypothetical protein ACE1SV_63900 [Streptomyces sennicomposti]